MTHKSQFVRIEDERIRDEVRSFRSKSWNGRVVKWETERKDESRPLSDWRSRTGTESKDLRRKHHKDVVPLGLSTETLLVQWVRSGPSWVGTRLTEVRREWVRIKSKSQCRFCLWCIVFVCCHSFQGSGRVLSYYPFSQFLLRLYKCWSIRLRVSYSLFGSLEL